jgi:hypothetical protein
MKEFLESKNFYQLMQNYCSKSIGKQEQEAAFETIKESILGKIKAKSEDATMNLYRITLAYGYDYDNNFSFLVVAQNIALAIDISIKTFIGYDYGIPIFSKAEFLATEGQYTKHDILLIAE